MFDEEPETIAQKKWDEWTDKMTLIIWQDCMDTCLEYKDLEFDNKEFAREFEFQDGSGMRIDYFMNGDEVTPQQHIEILEKGFDSC